MKIYKCPKCGSTNISILTSVKQGESMTFEKAISMANHKAARCNNCNLFIKPIEEKPDYDIPVNTYKKIDTPNPEAVRGICQAFLRFCTWSTFHPVSDRGIARNKHHYIMKHKNSDKFYGFRNDNNQYYNNMRIHDCDVRAAIKILLDKGYHLFRVYEYGTWEGYRISEKPYMDDGVEVTDFNGSID